MSELAQTQNVPRNSSLLPRDQTRASLAKMTLLHKKKSPASSHRVDSGHAPTQARPGQARGVVPIAHSQSHGSVLRVQHSGARTFTEPWWASVETTQQGGLPLTCP